jgi:hypothetical protein
MKSMIARPMPTPDAAMRLAESATDHHGRDHHEVEHGRARAQQVQAVAVDHANADHDEDPRERRDRHPGDEAPEDEECADREHAFDEAGKARASAARDVHQRGAHLAGTGDAADHAGGEIAQALRDELAVRIVAGACQRIEHDAGFQRIDREEDREGRCRHDDAGDVREGHASGCPPAFVQGVKEACARAAKRADDERVSGDG